MCCTQLIDGKHQAVYKIIMKVRDALVRHLRTARVARGRRTVVEAHGSATIPVWTAAASFRAVVSNSDCELQMNLNCLLTTRRARGHSRYFDIVRHRESDMICLLVTDWVGSLVANIEQLGARYIIPASACTPQ